MAKSLQTTTKKTQRYKRDPKPAYVTLEIHPGLWKAFKIIVEKKHGGRKLTKTIEQLMQRYVTEAKGRKYVDKITA